MWSFCTEHCGHLVAGMFYQLICLVGGYKLAVGICITVGIYMDHGVDDRLGDLGSGGAVEMDDRAAIDYPF